MSFSSEMGEFSEEGFTGTIQNFKLLDVIQMGCLSGSSRTIKVSTSDGQEGIIVLKDGKVVHASYGDMEGEEAFYEIVRWKKGKIEVEEDVPDIRTITERWETLLLEGIRRSEESSASVPSDGGSDGNHKLQMLQEKLASQLPGVVICAVISVEDGSVLAGYPSSDISIPTSLLAEAYRSIAKAFDLTEWGTPREVLIPGDRHTVVMVMLKDGSYCQGISVRAGITMGMVRATLAKFKSEIEAFLP